MLGRGFLYHVLDRSLVIRSPVAVAEILIGEFPPLQWINEPVAKASLLFVGCDVQKQLHETNTRVDQQALKLVDLAISAPPLLAGRETLYPLHQHAAIPGPVEHNNLPLLRQASPKALKIVLGTLVFVRCADRMDLETAWIKGPAKAANHSSLSRGVPSLKRE